MNLLKTVLANLQMHIWTYSKHGSYRKCRLCNKVQIFDFYCSQRWLNTKISEESIVWKK